MFKTAIVRKPGQSLIHGLTTAALGIPDYKTALAQHAAYVNALEACGLEVLVLAADERYPDSTFVEDVALLTKECAIILNPGAPSRKGETAGIKNFLRDFCTNIEEVREPGTAEGGDIMMVGSHFYIGLSERSNEQGARQVIAFLEKYGMRGSVVRLENVLHLKTGVAYLEQNTLVASGEFLTKKEFKRFNILQVDADEGYAANCVWVNGRVLLSRGYPRMHKTIESAGYEVIELDVSEFRKLDGGLSCLSLRW